LDAYKLNDCSFLAPVRSLTLDIEIVDEYLKTPLSREKPLITFRVLSGSDDIGDQQQPAKTVLMRGVLNWTGGKVEFVKIGGEPENKILFSVGFPKDKKPVGEGHQRVLPLGKIKHQGVQIFRINQPLKSGSGAEDVTKTGLEVTKMSDAGEASTAPYLKITPKTSLMTKMASFAGMAFEKTAFQCHYLAAQKVATLHPIVGLIENQIGYTIRFASTMPHPEHQSKAVILAAATLMLMKLGPVEVEKSCDLRSA